MRSCQMLGLDRIDNPHLVTKTILQPARDPVEIEERRRVFWAAFYCDRWASAGTMWSMMVDEAAVNRHSLACASFTDHVDLYEHAV